MDITSHRYNVKAVFLTRLLGTAPASKEVYKNFIASKRADMEERKRKMEERTGVQSQPTPGSVDEELESLREDAGMTVFHNDKGEKAEDGTDGKGLHLYDYQIAGWFKECCEALNDAHGIVQVRSKLDNYLLVEPRRVYIKDEQGIVLEKPDFKLERPLRAMTMQGPRVSLACSEVVNPGRVIEFTLDFLPYLKSGKGQGKKQADVNALVDMIAVYSRRKGCGQWRSGGNGRMEVTVKKLEDGKENRTTKPAATA